MVSNVRNVSEDFVFIIPDENRLSKLPTKVVIPFEDMDREGNGERMKIDDDDNDDNDDWWWWWW